MNILLTSIGRRTYLVHYFKEALAGKGQVFVSNSNKTIAMNASDKSLITPLIYSEDYIPTLLDFCINNDVQIIMSVFDIDLIVLAKHRETFAQHGIRLILASYDSVEICNDKWKTYQFVTSLDQKTPQTFLHLEEAIRAIKECKINYPVIIKPRWGMASMAIYTADNEEELVILYKKSKKEIENSYLKYESALLDDSFILIQEKIEGVEYGIDIINDLDANYVDTFCKEKISMRAGETDLGKTVSKKPFEDLTKKISSSLRHEAICSIDCIKNIDGIYIIDMNCRISGHYPLSHLAGVNLPKLIIDWYNGKATNSKYLTFQENLLITKDLVPTIIE